MIRVAFVMGFGYGQANEDIAKIVNQEVAYKYILTQYSVYSWINNSLGNVSMMHYHCDIYVNTIDAIGLGLLHLQKIHSYNDTIEIDIIAHDLQYERANESGRRALNWLKQTPRNVPDIDIFLRFLEKVKFTDPKPLKQMRLNRLYESISQPWTCYYPLYQIVESRAKKRDFTEATKQYEQLPGAFYNHLVDIDRRLELQCNKKRQGIL